MTTTPVTTSISGGALLPNPPEVKQPEVPAFSKGPEIIQGTNTATTSTKPVNAKQIGENPPPNPPEEKKTDSEEPHITAPTPPKPRSRPLKSLARIIQIIWEAIKNIFKRGHKPNLLQLSQHTSDITSRPEKKVSIHGFLTLAMELRKEVLQEPVIPRSRKKMKPAEEYDQQLLDRHEASVELVRLARSLKVEMTSARNEKNFRQKNKLTPRIQKNLGNTCYMNAALQCLENAYGLDKECLNLISQDLTRRPEETLEKLEERILKQWSPIPDLSCKNLAEIEVKIATLEQEINALDDASKLGAKITLKEKQSILKKERDNLNTWLNNKKEVSDFDKAPTLVGQDEAEAPKKDSNERVFSLKYDLLEHKDKLLLKYSVVVFFQAKAFGTDEHVQKALETLHRIIFMIGRHDELIQSKGPFNQHEAACIFELWHEMLERRYQQTMLKTAKRADNTTAIQGPWSEPMSTLQIAFKGGSLLSSIHEELCRKHNKEDLIQKKEKQEALLKEAIDAKKGKKNKKTVKQLKASLAELDKEIKSFESLNIENANGQRDPYFVYEEKYTFTEAPPEGLTIHIKRFGYNSEEKKPFKIKDKIPYALDPTGSYTDLLDLTPYFNPDNLQDGPAHYKLTGFVVHSGEYGRGHYVAYVQREKGWFLCDDLKAEITPVKPSDLPFFDAYVLCYRLVK